MLGGLAAAGVAAAAYLLLAPTAEPPGQPPAPVAATTPAPETQPVETQPAAAQTQPAAAGATVVLPPAEPAAAPQPEAAADGASEDAAPPAPAATLDVARIEPDGAALFAGRAAPGETVEIRIAGAVAARAEAGADGAFVAFGSAPEGGAQRVEIVSGTEAAESDPVFLAAPTTDAPDAPPTVVLAARAEGVELLQAPARPAGEPVTLDTLSYAETGDVAVSGRGEALRRLRVWADAVLIAETTVGEDGLWSARSTVALEPGTYLLRVEALGADGRVDFTVSSPFRREAPDRLRLAEGDLVIQPGDTLWRIAENRYGQGVRYTLIFDANRERIRDPDLIYPGQVFSIPEPAAD
jgi:nucleoid-associated protein YgaU